MVTKSYIAACSYCLGSRKDPRDRRRRCRWCNGSGRMWKPDLPSESAPETPYAVDAVIVTRATCDRCGHDDVGEPSPLRIYSRSLFKQDIWCSNCRGGVIVFEFREPTAEERAAAS